MTPTPRAAMLLLVIALLALTVSRTVTVAMGVLAIGLVVADGFLARRRPELARTVPRHAARGRPYRVAIALGGAGDPDRVTVRQASAPFHDVVPEVGVGGLDATVVPRRRGRHELPAVAARRRGPLGLGAWQFSWQEPAPVDVYPDVPAAQMLARAVRARRFGAAGRRRRGPLGLGTEFESVRDYLPDDDVRQVNWRATARLGRPMSNQYRVEQDRDVLCLVDSGRLMAAPVGAASRLDRATDAAIAVAAVADALGDRCGLVAFADRIRRRVAPRRAASRAVVEALYDLEPVTADSDYDVAFQAAGRGKRSLVIVLTDLLDEAAAQSLLDAVPILTRRHVVVVASTRDDAFEQVLTEPPTTASDVYRAVAALPIAASRATLKHRLRHFGADIVDASGDHLAEACVAAYLRVKAHGRL